jgi:hypothetical protein
VTKAKQGENVVDYDEPRQLTSIKGSNQAWGEINSYPVTYSTYSVDLLELRLPRQSYVMFPRDATPDQVNVILRNKRSQLVAFLEQCYDLSLTETSLI